MVDGSLSDGVGCGAVESRVVEAVSGVYIKGMDMPKTCEECALNYDSYACIKTGSRFFRDKDSEFDPFKGRLEDCPLVPVPPHGRLIDADKLCLSSGFSTATEYGRGRSDQIEAIKSNAPTIIPADKEEKA